MPRRCKSDSKVFQRLFASTFDCKEIAALIFRTLFASLSLRRVGKIPLNQSAMKLIKSSIRTYHINGAIKV